MGRELVTQTGSGFDAHDLDLAFARKMDELRYEESVQDRSASVSYSVRCGQAQGGALDDEERLLHWHR